MAVRSHQRIRRSPQMARDEIIDATEAALGPVDILVTNVDYIELMLFQQVDLGATLKELTGVPSADYSLIYTGLVGDLPPSTIERLGDDLIIGGHVPMTLPGFFAAIE